jgi:hypothetical protein
LFQKKLFNLLWGKIAENPDASAVDKPRIFDYSKVVLAIEKA